MYQKKGFKTTLLWNGISQLGNSGIQFLSTIILARILTPDDFAIVGIVSIFLTLASMMVDSEMGGALLKKTSATDKDYSTLFYYNLLISILIYVVLYCIAPLIGKFYQNENIISVIRVISITILIHAFRIVQQIIIFRQLDFKVYAIINICSGILSLSIAIILAYLDFGYWALVVQTLVSSLLMTIGMISYNKFIPSLIFSSSSFKYQFKFGISLLGSDFVKTIANNLSTNIIAKIATLSETGYYTQAARIPNFFQGFIGSLLNQSIFPMMAKITDKNEFNDKYRTLIISIMIGSFTLSLFTIFFAEPIIRLLLGDQWLNATPYFIILSISVMPMTIQILDRNILKASGLTKPVLSLEIVKAFIVLGCLFYSSTLGMLHVVWCVSISQCLSAIIWMYSTGRLICYKKEIYNIVFFVALTASLILIASYSIEY